MNKLIWTASSNKIKWTMILTQFMQLREKPEKKKKKKIRTVISQSGFFFSLRTQLHKLGSQLRGSLFIWLHFRSSYMIYFLKLYIYHRLNNFFFSCVFIYWFVLLFCSYSSSRDWLIKQSLKYKVLCGYKENRQSSKSEKALG